MAEYLEDLADVSRLAAFHRDLDLDPIAWFDPLGIVRGQPDRTRRRIADRLQPEHAARIALNERLKTASRARQAKAAPALSFDSPSSNERLERSFRFASLGTRDTRSLEERIERKRFIGLSLQHAHEAIFHGGRMGQSRVVRQAESSRASLLFRGEARMRVCRASAQAESSRVRMAP